MVESFFKSRYLEAWTTATLKETLAENVSMLEYIKAIYFLMTHPFKGFCEELISVIPTRYCGAMEGNWLVAPDCLDFIDYRECETSAHFDKLKTLSCAELN